MRPCSNCGGGRAIRGGRCNPCATYWYTHNEERPEELIVAHNRRLDAQLRHMSLSHQAITNVVMLRHPALTEKAVRRIVEQIHIAKPIDWPDTCFLWAGATTTSGYGQATFGGRHVYAHRLLYQLMRGQIPEGMVIDHLCRQPLCVNPAHLEVVTNAENIRRGNSPGAIAARTNRCMRGHELTPENTYIRLDNGHRMCRACRRERDRLRTVAVSCG